MEKSIADRLNRFIMGGEEQYAAIQETIASDPFTQWDFFVPLLFMLLITLSRVYFTYIAPSDWWGGAFIFILQLLMLGDLLERMQKKRDGRRTVGFLPPSPGGWRTAFGIYLITLPIIYFSIVLNVELVQWFHGIAPRVVMSGSVSLSMTALPRWSEFVLVISSTSILAPITEELWFRGIGLAGFMKNRSPLYAVMWTSCLFGPLHGLDRFLFATVFGLILALIRLRTGSLYTSVVVHSIHNTLAVFLPLYF